MLSPLIAFQSKPEGRFRANPSTVSSRSCTPIVVIGRIRWKGPVPGPAFGAIAFGAIK